MYVVRPLRWVSSPLVPPKTAQSVSLSSLNQTIIRAPAAGLVATQASGGVGADGTFEITTERPGDGAAIGKHNVSYSAPGDERAEWDGYGTPPPVKVSPYKNLASSVKEFEVKSGQNELNIELVPAR